MPSILSVSCSLSNFRSYYHVTICSHACLPYSSNISFRAEMMLLIWFLGISGVVCPMYISSMKVNERRSDSAPLVYYLLCHVLFSLIYSTDLFKFQSASYSSILNLAIKSILSCSHGLDLCAVCLSRQIQDSTFCGSFFQWSFSFPWFQFLQFPFSIQLSTDPLCAVV